MIDEAAEPPTLAELAATVGLSRFHLQRLFKRVVGVTPKAYASARRSRRFAAELAEGGAVTAAIYAAGFGSSSRAYETAAGALGMRPAAYRAGGAGAVIRFAIARSYLGWALVAATERGVCAIELGDTRRELERALARRFPRAALRGGDPDFVGTVAAVLAFLESPRGGLDLPLDVRGTAFQRRVWEALRAIPAGETATYADVAARIGRPSAARAVAQACAANRVAAAIPCHRVVRGNGSLGGYRWGAKRKRALQARERGGRATPAAPARARGSRNAPRRQSSAASSGAGSVRSRSRRSGSAAASAS
jgi:AraC family transcriptional regulator of adaptative response/methylated-DNA-[protein]-cysteine methyltransferase